MSDIKAAQIFDIACGQIDTLPHTESTKRLITQATEQLNAIEETIAATLHEMQRLAAMLPEYPVVMSFSGVGDVLGPQLIAEIGDVRRFSRKQSLVAFAGVDAPPYQSGTFESKNRRISKRGSPVLRKTLFLVMRSLIQRQSEDDPIYQFMDKKRR